MMVEFQLHAGTQREREETHREVFWGAEKLVVMNV